MKPRYDDRGEQVYICGLCADTGVMWERPYTPMPGRAVECPDCKDARHTFDYHLERYKLWVKREKHKINAGQAASYLLYDPYRDEILATIASARPGMAVQLSIFQ